ncbi:SKP1-like protein 1B [Tanacetum coccineum]
MSDYIPLEIQMEIMHRLPVKSLLQFRTVSKTWKSFIDNFKFIVSYGVRPNSNYSFGGEGLLRRLFLLVDFEEDDAIKSLYDDIKSEKL